MFDVGGLVLFSLAFLVPETWQAPGDVDAPCLAASYPQDWRVLMDSYNYENLIEGDDSVWLTLDLGGQGQGWSQTSGPCQRSVQVCDLTVEPESRPEHWIITQAISFLTARAVIVELAFEFTDCSDVPGCSVTSFGVLVNETNEGRVIEASDRSNFELAFTVGNTLNSPVNFSFSPSGNFSMFHLGIVDIGACISVRRMIVYYRVRPSTEVGLVFIPEVALPSVGSAPVSVLAVCADNSTNITSREVLCDGTGECSGTPMCACDPAFEFIEVISQCRACSPGTVKTNISNNDTCVKIVEITTIQHVTNIVPVAVLGALLGTVTVACLLLISVTVWCWKQNTTSATIHSHSEQQATTVAEPYIEVPVIGVAGNVPAVTVDEQANTARDEVSMASVNGIPGNESVLTMPASLTAYEHSVVVVVVNEQLDTAALSADEMSLKSAEERESTPTDDQVKRPVDERKGSSGTKPEVEYQKVVYPVAPTQTANTNNGTVQQQSGGIGSLVSRAGLGLANVASAVMTKLDLTIPSYARSDSVQSGDLSTVNEGGGFSLAGFL